MFARKITLKNGHSVMKPFDVTIFIVVLMLVVCYLASSMTGFNLRIVVNAPDKLADFFSRLLPMNVGYFSKITTPILETLSMSFLGTLLAGICAFPTMYLCANNLNGNKFLVVFIRTVLSIIRTIPITVFALIFGFIFGLGTFAGMLAVWIFTYSILTKMMYDYVETVDMKAYEAMIASGATRVKSFWCSIVPQISGTFLSQMLYNFEMNIRSSAILGYVGAGGIGIILNDQLSLMIYQNVTPILLSLFFTVLIVEFISREFRKRLS